MRTRNTSKEATVAKYIDEFLKGRPQAARDEFKSRPIERQYASISQWRRAKRKKEETPRAVQDIYSLLERVREMVRNSDSISASEAGEIRANLERVGDELDRYMESQRQRRIAALESEQQRIAMQLEALREKEEL